MDNEIVVNGVTYVRKDADTQGLPYCIVRTYSAGVFAGYVKERNGKEGVLVNARRLWEWYGAKEICEIATLGIAEEYRERCRFSIPSKEIQLTEIIEVQPCSPEVQKIMEEIKVWTTH